MRPRKNRLVRSSPAARYYKPHGISMRQLQTVNLKDEEWEAILMADYKGMAQEEASELMGVSRPTFSRVLSSARGAIAKALAEGAAIEIGGGDFEFVPGEGRGRRSGKGRGCGNVMGRGNVQRGGGCRGSGSGQGRVNGNGRGAGACNIAAQKETAEETAEGIEEVMKIAFTTTGEDLSAPMEEKFGRSPAFLIFDLSDESVEIIVNGGVDSPQGAGIKAAETIAKAGAKILVTGECGPKACKALESAGIEVYSARSVTVKEALDLYNSGDLERLQ